MSTQRYQKGMDKLRELTVPDQTSPTGHMDIGEGFKDVAPDLQRFVVEFAFGDIYARPGLDNKQKVLTTISALVAQGTPQIGMHVITGLNVGLKPVEIVGCIMHLIPYVGFPRALNALRVAQDVFAEQGVSVEDLGRFSA
ncbi:carboxymuconolactone decarboxylase family protein [Pseudomonas sp. NP21570]|jgi:4-carboxymuconolactone decarboxylase|uniref:Carboxymuconolactone decarboxylase family protein n=1 Tax=Ectopseudomonas oleovorans TaxID=301 RepID=A0A3R8X7N2_ECTOL|nr:MULTISPECIES: carboxymuconolactone decarboxylase family protein [Gammaproteobacteria]MCB4797168.1 carboxymuconolactone decarboxylase family protein [Pseudomonas sp. NP21570]MBC5090674.1 carboxymuconolactone decarboxylase family protein [Klebsiella quasipneumoniae]MBC5127950.1 carboxymuconolactone decarboxylase family protein [Klebsiella quasipneumoniae]MBC5133956.1 carboxymuconolactone decarboxylase family protein [Klebsiella quasipneumoniae]MBC5207046.1 carboxymuconolactone decarboxylase f